MSSEQTEVQKVTQHFQMIFFNKNHHILNQISLKHVSGGPSDSGPDLFQVMVWCQKAIVWIKDDQVQLCQMSSLCHRWWHYRMETFSSLLDLCAGNSPVTTEFPSQKPVTRYFDVFFYLRLNKCLSKQSRRRWFEVTLPSIMTSL